MREPFDGEHYETPRPNHIGDTEELDFRYILIPRPKGS
jgi:hypothetical protein